MTTLSDQRNIQSARDSAFCAAHNLTSADAFAGCSPVRTARYLADAEACLQAALDRVREMRRIRSTHSDLMAA
ncbi:MULTISPECIES: hypothetical protein [unclassified Brevundimonas]|uniref:hypothetical protein n=1 Tax=unclassified Brevundimonas TaxID=2622653 RepID=UPI0025BB9E46|nr:MULTISPECIES: hypothetical protein [unclassified Brevundimonas]